MGAGVSEGAPVRVAVADNGVDVGMFGLGVGVDTGVLSQAEIRTRISREARRWGIFICKSLLLEWVLLYHRFIQSAIWRKAHGDNDCPN